MPPSLLATPCLPHEPVDAPLRDLLARVADQVGEGVAVFDVDDWLVYANSALAALHDCRVEDLLGQHLSTFLGPAPAGAERGREEAELAGDGVLRAEISSRRLDGTPLDVDVTVSSLRDDSGTRIGRIVCVHDVTLRKQLEMTLERASLHDPLTDLPNRRLLTDRLEQALAKAHRDSTAVAVLFLDLDGFKQVNDSHGHAIGDKLLLEVVDRWHSCLRVTVTLARLGGDEFVVLLEQVTDAEDAEITAQRLRESLTSPFSLDGIRVHMTASIGVALDASATSRGLLHAADSAMYEAKSAGRGLVVISP